MKLRKEFWERSKDLTKWCSDEELRVLAQTANKELERRYTKAERRYLPETRVVKPQTKRNPLWI